MGKELLAVLFLAGCREPPREAPPAPKLVDPPAVAPTDAATTPHAPAQLACIAKLYVGTPELRDDRWVLALPDGRSLTWDDGKSKTPDERLEAPDLEDMLAVPYSTGAISPIADPAHDPGRVRVSELFEATYGASREAVRAKLKPWTFHGTTQLVHERALPAFEAVKKRLDALLQEDPSLQPWFDGMGGTFNWRPIAGTHRPSAHSFGVSLDLNPARSHYWRNDPKAGWKNTVPASIVAAFEAEQFAWGGRWFHYDTMHFEWRPELFACR